MAATVSIRIDGKSVEAGQDMTVLQAARQAGIAIPALCYHDKTIPHGACRLCSVEVESAGKVRVVAACGYPVADGLVVRTRSPRIDRIRKVVLELIAPQAMSQGEISGDLKKMSDDYGADPNRFAARLNVKPTRCTLCGLCVRYCDEVVGAHAIGFVGRGIDKRVAFFPERASRVCAGCMACFRICPTGKIGAEADGNYFGFTVDGFLGSTL
ncbi:MAG: 2Fe-2S iron-sulfur cluster-binding protein [Chloroflexi bacterium]|nr:2Fe-2S iron-sulfur cluster-binding protein [Chloroflexota bacterium]